MVSECLHTMKSIKAPPRRTRPGQWYGQVHGSCTWLPSAIILLQGSTFTSAWTKLITLNQLLCNLMLWKVSRIEQHDMSYLQLRRVKQGVKGVPVKFNIYDTGFTHYKTTTSTRVVHIYPCPHEMYGRITSVMPIWASDEGYFVLQARQAGQEHISIYWQH